MPAAGLFEGKKLEQILSNQQRSHSSLPESSAPLRRFKSRTIKGD